VLKHDFVDHVQVEAFPNVQIHDPDALFHDRSGFLCVRRASSLVLSVQRLKIFSTSSGDVVPHCPVIRYQAAALSVQPPLFVVS
jgi:hypothetical protein